MSFSWRQRILTLFCFLFLIGGLIVPNQTVQADGTWTVPVVALDSGSQITAMATAPNGDIYVGGSFSSFNGVSVSNVVRWNSNNSTWEAIGYDTPPMGNVYAMTFDPAGNLYTSGSNGLYKLANGNNYWEYINDAKPTAMVASSNMLYMNADANNQVVLRRVSLADYTIDSVIYDNNYSSVSDLSGSIVAMTLGSDNKLYVAGNFYDINGHFDYAYYKIAAISLGTESIGNYGSVEALGQGIGNGDTNQLISYNGEIYAAGDYTNVCVDVECSSSIYNSSLIKWSGSVWSSVDAVSTSENNVQKIAVSSDNSLYVLSSENDTSNKKVLQISRLNNGSWTTEKSSLPATDWLLGSGLTVGGTTGTTVMAAYQDVYGELALKIAQYTAPVIDNDPPAITVDIANAVYSPVTFNHNNTFKGTTSDVSGVASVQVAIRDESNNKYWNGSSWMPSEFWFTPTGTTSWTWVFNDEPALSNGKTYRVLAKAADTKGNSGVNSDTFTYRTVASSAPTGIYLYQTTTPGRSTNPKFRITGTNTGDTVQIFSDNCVTKVGSGIATGTTGYVNNVSLTSLADGTYTYKTNLVDALGLTTACSSVSVSYAIDRTAPTLTINNLQNNFFGQNTLTPSLVGGNVSDVTGVGSIDFRIASSACIQNVSNCNASTFKQTTLQASNGQWSYDLTSLGTWLANEQYTVSANAVDTLGNIAASAQTTQFRYDSRKPVTGIVNPGLHVYRTSAVDPGDYASGLAHVYCKVTGEANYTDAGNSDCSREMSSDGIFSYYLVDNAGNMNGTAENPRTFEITGMTSNGSATIRTGGAIIGYFQNIPVKLVFQPETVSVDKPIQVSTFAVTNSDKPEAETAPVLSFTVNDITAQPVTFSLPYEMMIKYTTLLGSGDDPTKLKLYTREEGTSTWTLVPTTLNTSEQTVSATLNHFSEFVLTGKQNEQTGTPVPEMAGDAMITVQSGGAPNVMDSLVTFEAKMLTGTVQQSVGSLTAPWVAKDPSGSGQGWHVEITATDFISGSHSIAIANAEVKQADSTVALVYGNALPTASQTTFAALGTTPVKLLTAGVGAGMGTYNFSPDFALTIPASTYAGVYTAPVTLSIIAAP